MSVEEYLAFEKDSPIRHEYVGGVAYAMTGGSGRHNRIAGKIYRRLSDIAEGSPCRVYVSDMKVRIPDRPFYYPDVMVACGREPEHPYYYVEDPCLIVEVISPNTESTDRREKLEAYKKLPTLKAYLMVSQEEKKSNATSATRTTSGGNPNSPKKVRSPSHARRTRSFRWATFTKICERPPSAVSQ